MMPQNTRVYATPKKRGDYLVQKYLSGSTDRAEERELLDILIKSLNVLEGQARRIMLIRAEVEVYEK